MHGSSIERHYDCKHDRPDHRQHDESRLFLPEEPQCAYATDAAEIGSQSKGLEAHKEAGNGIESIAGRSYGGDQIERAKQCEPDERCA